MLIAFIVIRILVPTLFLILITITNITSMLIFITSSSSSPSPNSLTPPHPNPHLILTLLLPLSPSFKHILLRLSVLFANPRTNRGESSVLSLSIINLRDVLYTFVVKVWVQKGDPVMGKIASMRSLD